MERVGLNTNWSEENGKLWFRKRPLTHMTVVSANVDRFLE